MAGPPDALTGAGVTTLTPALRAHLATLLTPPPTQLRAVPIKVSATPAHLERLFLTYGGAGAGPATLIAKWMAPEWPGDPAGQQRECLFYRHLAPLLALPGPRIFHAGPLEGSEHWLLLMEDLAATHRFPPPTHRWRPEEMARILPGYARLHVRGRRLPLDEIPFLFPPYAHAVEERAADLPRMAHELAGAERLPPLPALERLLRATLDEIARRRAEPVTLLHNDVYPPNAALPGGTGEVVLLDWEMVGSGMAELDLAYLFCQPFGAERDLERASVLEQYWQAWEEAAGSRPPPPDERARRQRHADALLALWLLPVAHARAFPTAPLSGPTQRYWTQMFMVLGRRLEALCGDH